MLNCIYNCETCKWIEFKGEYPFCILTQKQVALFYTCFMFSSPKNKKDINFATVSNTLNVAKNSPNFNSKE